MGKTWATGTVYPDLQTMDTPSANAQVTHMRDFILHEATEKADEIDAKAEQDYHVEKQRLVEEERLRIKKEYERREKNVELETKIANATETNKNKLLVLSAASAQVENTFSEAYEALKKVPGTSEYEPLLVSLIQEGVKMLGLSEVKVMCRAADKAKVMSAIGKVGSGVKINLDDTDLTTDNSVTNVDSQCIGGVLVSSMDGKVVVSQTLNARLQIAYDTALPVVKPVLFNQQGSKHTDKY